MPLRRHPERSRIKTKFIRRHAKFRSARIKARTTTRQSLFDTYQGLYDYEPKFVRLHTLVCSAPAKVCKTTPQSSYDSIP
jgi:hypothetical protein